MTENRQKLKEMKDGILRRMPIMLLGRHSRRRFFERIGSRKPKSILRLLQKALDNGEIVSFTAGKLHILYKNRLYIFLLVNDETDGRKKLVVKSVLNNAVKEVDLYMSGKYRGKVIRNSNFKYSA